jgi:broad specificity phosphatase PhoE
VAAHVLGPASYTDPALHDAPLNDVGRAEARAAALALHREEGPFDLVVVSPLRRTLETASLLYDVPGVRRPPFLAFELVREAFGLYTCDQRSTLTDLLADARWSHVDFSHIGTDADTWHNPAVRETVGSVRERAVHFAAWLAARAEARILVVSHGVFLESLSPVLSPYDTARHGQYANVERRTFHLFHQPATAWRHAAAPRAAGGGGELSPVAHWAAGGGGVLSAGGVATGGGGSPYFTQSQVEREDIWEASQASQMGAAISQASQMALEAAREDADREAEEAAWAAAVRGGGRGGAPEAGGRGGGGPAQ